MNGVIDLEKVVGNVLYISEDKAELNIFETPEGNKAEKFIEELGIETFCLTPCGMARVDEKTNIIKEYELVCLQFMRKDTCAYEWDESKD
jgi:hypothetical protein